jgi:hypothetical protein
VARESVDRATSADTLKRPGRALQAFLNDASLSISGSTLLYLRRQSDVEYPEVSEGVTYATPAPCTG